MVRHPRVHPYLLYIAIPSNAKITNIRKITDAIYTECGASLYFNIEPPKKALVQRICASLKKAYIFQRHVIIL